MNKIFFISMFLLLVQINFVLANSNRSNNHKDRHLKIEDYKKVINFSSDNDSILKYANLGLKLAKKNNDTISLYFFYLKLGDANSKLNNFTNALKLYENAIKYSPKDLKTAGILKRKGSLLWKFHKYDEVLKVFLQALKIYERNGVALEMGKIYDNVGTIYKERYKIDSAIFYYSKALEIFKSIKDKHWQAHSLTLIGNAYLSDNKLPKAMHYYDLSKTLMTKINDSIGLSKSLTNIARVYKKQKLFRKSIDHFQKVLQLRQSLSNAKLIASTLNDIGGVYQSMGNYAKSIEYFQKSLMLRRQLSDQFDVANSLINIGTVYRDLNLLGTATTYYMDALKIFQKLGDELRISNCLNYIGGLYYKKGEFDHALDYYLSTLGYQELIDNKPVVAKVANNVAMIYKNMKNYSKSLEYYQYALKIYKETESKKQVANTNNNIGNLYKVQGDNKKALEYFQLAYNQRRKIGDISGLSKSSIDISIILYQNNKIKSSLKYLNKALKISKKIDDFELKDRIYYNLYKSNKRLRKYRKAMYYHEQYSKWSDSLFNKKTVAQLSQIQKQNETERSRLKLKYESEKQEVEITRLMKTKKIQEQNYKLMVKSEKNKKRFVISFVVLLILVLALLLNWYLIKSKSNKKLRKINDDLAEMNDLLQSSKNKLMELNQTKDKFFEIIEHDLKNPFNAFLSLTNLLSEDFLELPDDNKVSIINEIQTSAKSLYGLTENLLAWTKTQREGIEVSISQLNLRELSEGIINIYIPTISKKKLLIVNSIPEELIVNTDKYLLSFVLRSVINNAIKFTPQGGKITVKAKSVNSGIAVRVIDTGIGMTKEQLGDLFKLDKKVEPGTENEKGIGLGLVLCKEFIEKLQGLIQIESQVNIGTEFIILLPK